MAFSISQYYKLQDAIASGVKTVNYGDKAVTYHSLDEMVRLLKLMEQQLGIGKKTRTKAVFNKDLGVHQGFLYGGDGDVYINSI